MSERALQIEIDGPVAWVWMDRAESHNALTKTLIVEVTDAFTALGQDPAVRVIVLSGRGKSFSAGADIEMMKRLGSAGEEENLASARQLAEMFRSIACCPKPTVARVNGSAIGGGVGLVSACDIAIASSAAIFATTEVRLGIIPATIAPYVVRAIGARNARRLFLTGERIDAAHAAAIGLVHEVTGASDLDHSIQTIVQYLIAGAPQAQRQSKELIDAVAGRPITTELIGHTSQWIAAIRSGVEAREGLAAFLDKRPAPWVLKKDL